MLCGSHNKIWNLANHIKIMKQKNIRLLVFSFPSINTFWCFLFCFFMWFARFQSEPKSIWRKLLVLSWLWKNIYRLLRSASHRIQFCESCEPLTEVAEPEVDDLAAAIPEARALKELPPNMVFDLSLSLPIMRKYQWILLLKGNG